MRRGGTSEAAAHCPATLIRSCAAGPPFEPPHEWVPSCRTRVCFSFFGFGMRISAAAEARRDPFSRRATADSCEAVRADDLPAIPDLRRGTHELAAIPDRFLNSEV